MGNLDEEYALFTGIPADQDKLGRAAFMYRRKEAKSNSTVGSSKQEKDSPTVELSAWLGPALRAITAIIVGAKAYFKGCTCSYPSFVFCVRQGTNRNHGWYFPSKLFSMH